MALSLYEILRRTLSFAADIGGKKSGFRVGITDDPARRLREHRVGESYPHSVWRANNADSAREIEKKLADMGFDAGDNPGGGGNEESVYVYIYPKGSGTNP